MATPRPPLLIEQALPAIFDLINNNLTVAIGAPTGYGKSLGIPRTLAEKNLVVFSTTPLRMGATRLAESQLAYLRQQYDTPSWFVGYSANRETTYKDRKEFPTAYSRIAYVTEGHLSQRILRECFIVDGNGKLTLRPLDFCDVLIVDEAHGRTVDADLIVALWMYLHSHGIPVPRLVVVTATMDGIITISPPPKVYVVEAPNNYDITYIDPADVMAPFGTGTLDGVAAYANRGVIDNPHLLLTQMSVLAANIHRQTELNGHILLFVAGEEDVRTLTKNIDRLLKGLDNYELLQAYGPLDEEELRKIYLEFPNKRKIICSTNVAESSITIVDVAYVIDSLRVKQAGTASNGGKSLLIQYVSKNSAKQRAGRTGRTTRGRVFRMSSQTFFDQQLLENTPAQLDSIPIEEVCLRVYEYGMNPAELFPWLAPERVLHTAEELLRLGTITVNQGLVKVTDCGKFVTYLPMSARAAVLLYTWINGPIVDSARGHRLNDPAYDYTKFWPLTGPTMPADFYRSIDRELTNVLAPMLIGVKSPRVCEIYPMNGEVTIHLAKVLSPAHYYAVEPRAMYRSKLFANLTNIAQIIKSDLGLYEGFEVPVNDFSDVLPAVDLLVLNYMTIKPVTSVPETINRALVKGLATWVLVISLVNPANPLDLKSLTNYLISSRELTGSTALSGQTYELNGELATLQLNLYKLNTGAKVTPWSGNPVQLAALPPLRRGYDAFGGLIAASLIDSYGPHYYLPHQKFSESDNEYKLRVGKIRTEILGPYVGLSDFETAFNIYRGFIDDHYTFFSDPRNSLFTIRPYAIAEWSRGHSMNNQKLLALFTTIKGGWEETENFVRNTGADSARYGLNFRILNETIEAMAISVIREIARDVYSDGRATFAGQSRNKIATYRDFRDRTMNLNRNGLNRLNSQPGKGIIALSTITLEMGKVMIGMALDDDQGARTGINSGLMVDSSFPSRVPKTPLTGPQSSLAVAQEYNAYQLSNILDRLVAPNQLSTLAAWRRKLALNGTGPLYSVNRITNVGYGDLADLGQTAVLIEDAVNDSLLRPANAPLPYRLTADQSGITLALETFAVGSARMAVLLSLGNLEQIAVMILRYRSLKFDLGVIEPTAWVRTLARNYQLTLEWNVSPLTSAIIMVDRTKHFTSWFPDVDGPFGSVIASNLSNTRVAGSISVISDEWLAAQLIPGSNSTVFVMGPVSDSFDSLNNKVPPKFDLTIGANRLTIYSTEDQLDLSFLGDQLTGPSISADEVTVTQADNFLTYNPVVPSIMVGGVPVTRPASRTTRTARQGNATSSCGTSAARNFQRIDTSIPDRPNLYSWSIRETTDQFIALYPTETTVVIAARVANAINDLIRATPEQIAASDDPEAQVVTFPFHKLFVKEPIDIFRNLQIYQTSVGHADYRLSGYREDSSIRSFLTNGKPLFRGLPVSVKATPEAAYNVDVLSDLYIENLRIAVSHGHGAKGSVLDGLPNVTLQQVWDNELPIDDPKNLINILYRMVRDFPLMYVTPQTLRQYLSTEVQQATIFRPSWAIGLLNQVLGSCNLAGLNWLDISAGWGDRLLVAMALKMNYQGFDPNQALIPAHQKMIADFGDASRHRVDPIPFEQAELANEAYDVVLSSPPYFDLEIYAPGEVGQSIVSFPNRELWLREFLFASLRKAWSALKPGGHLILHLGDPTGELPLAQQTNLVISEFPNAVYEGVISVEGRSRIPRPVWVWLKGSGNVVAGRTRRNRR